MLQRRHPRKLFCSGQTAVDDWLKTKALQHQSKHLASTKVLVTAEGVIAGYYTLAPAQIDFADLPPEIIRRLPQRMLPIAILAWLGVDQKHQHRGLGGKLLAQALRDCWEGSKVFPFVLVIVDCVDDNARSFYERFGFTPLPGQPYRLFLSAQQLDAMMQVEPR